MQLTDKSPTSSILVRRQNAVAIMLNIFYEVAIYRLKRREMANLLAAFSIMFAFRLAWDDVLMRILFCIFLNLFIYLNNDYYNVEQDLISADGDHKKALYLREHMGAAVRAQILLILLLVSICVLWNYSLLIALVAACGICWIYSWKLKNMPFLDFLTAFLGGTAVVLAAFPIHSLLGWLMAFQLGLFAVCFQLIQMLRDYEDDAATGVRTTVVRVGQQKTYHIIRAATLISAVYAISLLHMWFGLLLLILLIIPLSRENVDKYWNRVRMVMGVVWLLVIGWVYIYGSSNGLFLVVSKGYS